MQFVAAIAQLRDADRRAEFARRPAPRRSRAEELRERGDQMAAVFVDDVEFDVVQPIEEREVLEVVLSGVKPQRADRRRR